MLKHYDLIFYVFILLPTQQAVAELWQCSKIDGTKPFYTTAPVQSDKIKCGSINLDDVAINHI